MKEFSDEGQPTHLISVLKLFEDDPKVDNSLDKIPVAAVGGDGLGASVDLAVRDSVGDVGLKKIDVETRVDAKSKREFKTESKFGGADCLDDRERTKSFVVEFLLGPDSLDVTAVEHDQVAGLELGEVGGKARRVGKTHDALGRWPWLRLPRGAIDGYCRHMRPRRGWSWCRWWREG